MADSDNVNREIEQNQKALPTSAELPAFFDTLNRKVGEAGVEVKKWAYKKEVSLGSYFQVPLEVEITGTFHQITRFFASLAPRPSSGDGEAVEQDRIITVEGLTLRNPLVKNREIILTASFTASTFRQDAPADAGAPKPGAPKPAAPAPAAGSASKNPVTNAGAKADAAMTKDQQRVDGAVGSADGSAAGGDRLKGGL
ncbi:MAG: type 4a pilus biogenesis protein PilO [Kofleriaceae bacterium]